MMFFNVSELQDQIDECAIKIREAEARNIGRRNSDDAAFRGINDRLDELGKSVKGFQVLLQRMANTNKRIDRILGHMGLYEHQVKQHTKLRSNSGHELEDE